MGQDVYSIASRGGVKVTRTRLYGATSRHNLVIYDDGTEYDVYIVISNANYPSIVIRSFINTLNSYTELPVTGGATPTGTVVAYTLQNHIMVDNDGNVGIGTLTPSQKLDVNGTTRTKILQISGGADLAEPFAIFGAESGPIHPGDLLTSSNTPGHAMAVTDVATAQGAIVGKAMSVLEQGVGLILVLVTLQ